MKAAVRHNAPRASAVSDKFNGDNMGKTIKQNFRNKILYADTHFDTAQLGIIFHAFDEALIDLSESAGSVSCEAHRPEDLRKKFEDAFCYNEEGMYNGAEGLYFVNGVQPQNVWEWIETNCLKVR